MKLKYDKLLSNFALKCSLRPCSVAASIVAQAVGVPEMPAGGEACRALAARRAVALRPLARRLA